MTSVVRTPGEWGNGAWRDPCASGTASSLIADSAPLRVGW
jgi:hypothetical protein